MKVSTEKKLEIQMARAEEMQTFSTKEKKKLNLGKKPEFWQFPEHFLTIAYNMHTRI